MVDLYEFYISNVKENDFHYRFFDFINEIKMTSTNFFGAEMSEGYEFKVYDEEEGIEIFRRLAQPCSDDLDDEGKCWFYLLTYYLNKQGFVIEQFPQALQRPPVDPSDFIYCEIRNKALALNLDDNGTVRWDTRRSIVAQMNFKRASSALAVSEDLDQIIQMISTRNAQFCEMSADEKLEMLVNLLENLLKTGGNYVKPDYSKVMFNYVSDEIIKEFRGQLQCFRHSSVKALEERKKISDEQKSFLIDYGVTICKAVHALVK